MSGQTARARRSPISRATSRNRAAHPIHRQLEQWARRATRRSHRAHGPARASFEQTESRRLPSIPQSARRRARGKAVTLQNRGAHRERILPLFPRLAARIEVAQFPSLQFTKDMRRLARWVSSTAPPPRPMVLTVSTHCPCPRNCPRRRTTQRILRIPRIVTEPQFDQ